MLDKWELDNWGRGVLILKEGELEPELEHWKTDKNGSPGIADGLRTLSGEAPRSDEIAPMLIWPNGRFLLYYVPWAEPNQLSAWGRQIEQMDERLSFDEDQSLGKKWDFSAEGFSDEEESP